MNKKQQPFFNPELSGFCSQMAMILHSGISPLEGITVMLEDSTSDREKDILQQILDTLQETADFSLSLKPVYFLLISSIWYKSVRKPAHWMR